MMLKGNVDLLAVFVLLIAYAGYTAFSELVSQNLILARMIAEPEGNIVRVALDAGKAFSVCLPF